MSYSSSHMLQQIDDLVANDTNYNLSEFMYYMIDNFYPNIENSMVDMFISMYGNEEEICVNCSELFKYDIVDHMGETS